MGKSLVNSCAARPLSVPGTTRYKVRRTFWAWVRNPSQAEEAGGVRYRAGKILEGTVLLYDGTRGKDSLGRLLGWTTEDGMECAPTVNQRYMYFVHEEVKAAPTPHDQMGKLPS